jgi:hypothetical protein
MAGNGDDDGDDDGDDVGSDDVDGDVDQIALGSLEKVVDTGKSKFGMCLRFVSSEVHFFEASFVGVVFVEPWTRLSDAKRIKTTRQYRLPRLP